MLQQAGVPLGAGGAFIPLSGAERADDASRPVDYPRLVTDAMAHLKQSGAASDPKSGYQQWRGILLALATL